MTLRLILMRHAKSSWDDPTLGDHARPLDDRGRRSAAAIGRWLNERSMCPARVLSSDSVRTRETWDLVAEALAGAPAPEWRADLYHATPETILLALRAAGTANPLLVLGHNPGIGEAAHGLARTLAAHPKFEKFPTAATAVLDFQITDWSLADWGKGAVRQFVVPRDLGVT